MRLAIEKKDLLHHIQHLAAVVPTKNTSPILTNYLFVVDAESSTVQITATDLEITVVVKFNALVSEGGSIAIAARQFNEIISSMPDQVINLYKDEDLLKIQCGRIDFSLMCADYTLFPVLPLREMDNAIQVDAALFNKMVEKTIFAVSTDVNRAVLTGVMWLITDKFHMMSATDGRRVSEIKVNESLPTMSVPQAPATEENIFTGSNEFESIERIVPVKTLSFLQKVFDSSVKELRVLIDTNRIVFGYDKFTIFSQIIDHKYPDYRKAFVPNLPNTVVIGVSELRSTIRRISLLAPEENLRVRFEFANDSFEINTTNRETGEAKQVMENFSYQGTETSISINYKFMVNILDAIDTEKVRICLGSGKEPLMIYNEPSAGENQEITFLLMPLRS